MRLERLEDLLVEVLAAPFGTVFVGVTIKDGNEALAADASKVNKRIRALHRPTDAKVPSMLHAALSEGAGDGEHTGGTNGALDVLSLEARHLLEPFQQFLNQHQHRCLYSLARPRCHQVMPSSPLFLQQPAVRGSVPKAHR